MRPGADAWTFAGRGRGVEQAQHAVAAGGRAGEKIRRQPEMTRDGPQETLAETLERAEQPQHVRPERRRRRRPDIGGHDGPQGRAVWQFAADVPEFLEVGVARALGRLDAERRVAPLALPAGNREGSL